MCKPLKFNIFMKAIMASVVVSFSFVCVTLASPNMITFQSRIIKPDGAALEATSVNFRFSITDTVGSCVIYQEDFSNRNMSGSKGLINLAIGSGSKVFPVAAMTLLEVFNNYNSPTLNCQAGGNIVAGVTDRRKLIVQFNDGTGWQTVPSMDINSNPYALQADSAHKLGDFPAADYVRTATFPTCVGGEALHFNGASFTCVAVGGGAGTVTGVSSANADIGVSMASPTPVLTLNSGTGNNQIVKLTGTAELPAVSGVNLTALNASNLGSGTIAAARMPALTGDVTMTAGTTATSIANNAVTNTHVAAAAAIARSKLATGSANHVVVNDGITGAMSSIGCNNGEIIKWAAGVPTCSADAGGVGDILNAGNTTGAAVVIGTNDAQSLQFETNNAPAMTILSGGNVGIGTTSPGDQLHLDSNVSGYRGINITNNHTAGIPVLQVWAPGAGGAALLSNGSGGSIEMGISPGTNGIYFQGSRFGISNSSTSILNVTSAGNVGIGTTSPAAKLDVTDAGTTTSAIIVPRAGNFTGTTANGMIRYNTTSTLFEFYQNGAWVNYTTVSDGRLKTNVVPVTDGLDIINQLNPVFYDWDRSNPKASSFEDKHQVGFIAQEVEKVLPEVVNRGEDSYRSVEYGKIVSVVVAAVKELYTKFRGQDEKIQAQDRELASVKAEANAKAEKLEAENAELKARLDHQEKELTAQKQELEAIKNKLGL